MKYSRMLFLPKNDSLIVNILSVIEHSGNNKENVKFPECFQKKVQAYFTPLVFILPSMCKEMRDRRLL